MEKNIKLLGVGITDYPLSQILEYLIENLQNHKKKLFITTINSEILTESYKNPDYKSVLNSSHLAIIDGFWTQKSAELLGFRVVGRVPGVELMEIICKEVSKQPITVGLIGGRGNVAEVAAERLQKLYPGLKISFTIGEISEFEAKSKNLKCDILFVALGHPRQEIWIENNLPKIDVWAAMGVGGSFDFLSGKVKRAPKWMQKIGLEWFFRLLIQPWRVRRQLNLIYYVLLILKERLTGKPLEE